MTAYRQTRMMAMTVLVAGSVAAGCAKKVPPAAPQPPAPVVQPQTPPPQPPPQPPAPAPQPPAPPRVPTEDEIFASQSLQQINDAKPLAHVLFELDSYTLSDEARSALDRNATWLRRWPSTKITIEGHADSRGTNEYNLALGDRRAAAARDYLVSLGIAADRIAAISKGEEQPFCTEENEACWAQNRRGFFVVTAK